MLKYPDFISARALMIHTAEVTGTERKPLLECAGRILAENLEAAEPIPPFARSPYDGYAFRSVDSADASPEHPVTLQIIEEVPAGAVPSKICTEKTAVKILTGAPIPEGADAVRKYEETEFTEHTVTIFSPAESGENIVPAGVYIHKGDLLAEKGNRIEAKLMGLLAGQGVSSPEVYRIPKVGIMSTGNEVTEIGKPLKPGKIYDSNSYTLIAAVKETGCEPVYLGHAADSSEEIRRMFLRGLAECDAVISTGGVSVGDYDLTPEAMEKAGIRVLFRGLDLKPGTACAYGEKNGRIVCALSGNPVSALINFYAVAMPALKKITGLCAYMPQEIDVALKRDFRRTAGGNLLLKGKLEISDGKANFAWMEQQASVVSENIQGDEILLAVPADIDFIAAGTILRGIKI